MMDPDVKRTSKGSDGTAGFITYWDSQVKNVGKGEQEITQIDAGTKWIPRFGLKNPLRIPPVLQ